MLSLLENLKRIILKLRAMVLYDRKYTFILKNNFKLQFYSTNFVTKFRYDTFFSKEPETITWIENMEDDCLLWDIGANVGLYTIYCLAGSAKRKVVAFEPHLANLQCLLENLNQNKLLGDRITVVPNAVFSKNAILKFVINSTALGDSNHSILDSGNNKLFFNTPTMTVQNLIDSGLSFPNYLKIDVDGNELEIIRSASIVLNNNKLKGLLIELDLNNEIETNEIIQTLNSAGLFEQSRHDLMARYGKISHKRLYNFIFERK